MMMLSLLLQVMDLLKRKRCMLLILGLILHKIIKYILDTSL